MFKLQRLEITGFKSFADYTEIVFTGDGITAVVGPNGCGKSNVSESIAWVLGEQKAKSLRGTEMKDVIFQGTSRRKPSGMAEVVLHLIRDETPVKEDELTDIDETLGGIDDFTAEVDEIENPTIEQDEIQESERETGSEESDNQGEAVIVGKDGQATAVAPAKIKTKRHWRRSNVALDFAPGEAVSVTRRLYLSGESEYQLNGKTCRLRDIQDLFSGTGLSGAHYALIEQGRIGQILSAKPSDRRTLIEEAAGISKFRTRQRAAEARLESAKTNLRRISDIVEEIDKQANSLRRQAAKTRRYKILKEEFRELLRQVFAAEGKYLTELAGELETKSEEAVKREGELFADVTAKDESFRSATQKTRELEETLAEIRALHAENALRRDRASRDLVYKNEQTESLKSRSDILRGEIESLEKRLKLIKTERERLEKEEKSFSAEAEKEALNLREAEKIYQAKLAEVRNSETELEKYRNELLTHSNAVERFAEITRQLENNSERLHERAEGLRREGERAGESFDEHLAEKSKAEKASAEARKTVEKLRDRKTKLSEAVANARLELQTGERELTKIRDEFSRVNNRFETLRELDEKRAVYAPNVKKIFDEKSKIGVTLLGTLADKLNVAQGAEKTVENIFGSLLQTILVETQTDAKKLSAYIRQNNIGRIAVLAAGNSQSATRNNSKADKSSFKNLLGIEDDFANVLSEIFPREMSAQSIETVEDVKAKDGEDYFTTEGDLIFGGKLFISGKLQANEKGQSLLSFKRELRELETQGKKLAKDVEKAEKIRDEARRNLTDKEDESAKFQTEISEAERTLLSREIEEKNIRQELERAERHKKVVTDEIKQIEAEIKDLKSRQKDAETNAAKAETARKTASDKLSEVSEKVTALRQNSESENLILSDKKTLAATSSERRRSAQNALRRIESEESEIQSRLASLKNEIAANKTGLEQLNASITEITKIVSTADKEKDKEQSELAAAFENLRNARENADLLSSELAELNKISAEARNSRAEIEVKKAEAITKLQALNENAAHELNLSLVELVETVEVAEDFDLRGSRSEAENLRQRIEGFGAVNMLALEELSEAEERLQFLTAQRQDIIDSINSAEEALREIKHRSRERFRDAFNAVNEYFREFFLEMFGGGRGEMVLLEAEDILESGIEIVAQPPGKRLQNILLLSGGEKAMTAIALVMAIFQYRPSPFCLLDEVDAPLDEANVGRFVNKIAAMSEKTQFIVITHNKRTMEAAKALYGVTMAEPGVSSVVSVKFE